jgi:hypothetical protein
MILECFHRHLKRCDHAFDILNPLFRSVSARRRSPETPRARLQLLKFHAQLFLLHREYSRDVFDVIARHWTCSQIGTFAKRPESGIAPPGRNNICAMRCRQIGGLKGGRHVFWHLAPRRWPC